CGSAERLAGGKGGVRGAGAVTEATAPVARLLGEASGDAGETDRGDRPQPPRAPVVIGIGRAYNGGSTDAGWSSLVARRAHNPKVAGSNPAPATENPQVTGLGVSSLQLLIGPCQTGVKRPGWTFHSDDPCGALRNHAPFSRAISVVMAAIA